MPVMGNSPSRRSARLANRQEDADTPQPGSTIEEAVMEVEEEDNNDEEDDDDAEEDSESDLSLEYEVAAEVDGDVDMEFDFNSEEDDDEDEDDEEDEAIDEEDDVIDPRRAATRAFLMQLAQMHRQQAAVSRRGNRSKMLDQYGPLPQNPPHLQNELSLIIQRATDCCNPRYPSCPKEDQRMASTCADARTKNAAQFLWERTANLSGHMSSWSGAQCRHMMSSHYLPNKPLALKDGRPSKVYISQFSHQGDYFIAAYQGEKKVIVYDVEDNWKVKKDVFARNLRWTVTDTTLSNDQRFLVYATINSTLNLVNMTTGGVDSQANVTEVHESLHLNEMEVPEGQTAPRLGQFGIFSVKWSHDTKFLCAGTGGSLCNILLFDVEKQKTVQSIDAHQDDVNAVVFMDESSNVIASGSDDHLIKIWDKRDSRPQAGVLLGHTQGLTYLDPKGDGVYLLSNGKDQFAKVWDIRKLISSSQHRRLPGYSSPTSGWDYRMEDYPALGCNIRHPSDCSVQTLHGHSVTNTLIRAYWSPMHSTGQRYVYTGSADGHVYIFDVVTSKIMEKLTYHRHLRDHCIIRDVSWHPYNSTIVSGGFDGALIEWGHSSQPLNAHIDALPSTSFYSPSMWD